MKKTKTVIIVVGPTASGKTAFAIAAARLLQTEIISADSRQCFRELNIGVAKPSEEELRSVRHHFINTHSITEEVNAAIFETYALDAAATIFESNDVVVMAGGTGLYVKAFCEGLDDIPETDESIRRHITEQYLSGGLGWLQQEVQQRDPLFWSSAEQQNPQRLMRALEVVLSTGKSILSFRKKAKAERPFEIIRLGLELPREILYERINYRVDQMVAAGLVAEVRGLLDRQHLNALQTVGYRELFDHFDGKVSMDEAIETIKKNTRHYAKRQLTWFRRDESVQWIPATTSAAGVLSRLGF